MSNHRARPRSGEFSAQKLQQLEDTQHADSQEQRTSSARSPARSYSASYSQRSPTALIIDSGGGGRDSGSRGIRVPSADHDAHRHEHQHEQQQQRHRRVVSLSWPGEARLVERDADWDQQLQDMSRRISTSSSSSGSGSGCGSKAADELPVTTAVIEAPASATKAAPNKRQRQMAFSKKRLSSGPIDIPPSPRTAAASSSAAGARGFHGALARGDADDADSRGGRAATDAGEWYPCWSATRPDDKKCGEGGGPPEHILIWERAVRSGSQQHQAIGAVGGGGGSTRVSEGSARGQVVGLDDSEAEEADEAVEDDELLQMRPERRMSSDQGSSTVMLFEMDM